MLNFLSNHLEQSLFCQEMPCTKGFVNNPVGKERVGLPPRARNTVLFELLAIVYMCHSDVPTRIDYVLMLSNFQI